LLAAWLASGAALVPVASELAVRGGTLRLWYPTDWRSLDPAIAFDTDSVVLTKLLFRGLLDYDSQARIVPDQARKWSVTSDGRTYSFELHPDARFSHGRVVEAEDYVFALERILDPKTGSPGQTYYLEIEGARDFAEGRATRVRGLEAADRFTLRITLEKPSYTFRYVMAMSFASALPRELVRKHGADFQYHMAGSGPYRVTAWKRGVGWRLERNAHYFGSDGYVDAFDLMIGGDQALAAMMVERGDRDWANGGAVCGVSFLRDPARRHLVERVRSVSIQYFFLNTELKPFQDPRVRRAMNYAIDRERLVKLAAGFGMVATGIVPSSMPWTNSTLPSYPLDRAAAKRLLEEAGYADGFETEIYYIQTRVPDVKAAQSIQGDLAQVGIKVALKPLSQPAFEVKARTRREVASGVWGWVQDYPDPSNFLDVLLSGKRITDRDCNNLSFYGNRQVDDLLLKAEATLEGGERQSLYQQAERLMMLDAPWVPLMEEQYAILKNPRVRGSPWHPVWLWRFEKVWLRN